MDALVYEDTPLADYFEGEAIPYDSPNDTTPPHTPFAPCGLPNLKGRLKRIRRSATSFAPGSAYTEELLERFRYVIVASQLLSDETGPRPSLPDHETAGGDLTTLRGAAITATASFLLAWAIHWFRTRKRTVRSLTWIDVGTFAAGITLLAVVGTLFGRRQYTNYLQRASARTLTKYVDDSHGFDNTVGNVIRFIQEVEVVARGYGLGVSIPPITRLEDRHIVRRCQTLRRELAAALKLMTILMVQSHNTVQPYINKSDVQRYHDVYEVSIVEYSQAVELAKQKTEEAKESLKELRFSMKLYTLARRVFLCDLLALRQTHGWLRFRQWSNVLPILRSVESETTATQTSLSTALTEEEWGSTHTLQRRSADNLSESDSENPQGSMASKLQLRRLNDMVHAIRTLNAKMHVMSEEVNGSVNNNSEDVTVAATLSKHYESLGTDLRNLLSDWERGRSTMQLSVDIDHERASCASSSVRTPISPSPSLGGFQIVDGGPADALRLLNGDSPPSIDTKGILEEEVFEAVASRIPRKRMSVSVMTREEKIARLAEERRKRATLQEQSDNTTNMLRELQMVIKHRPKASLPSPATSNANVSTNRVASL